MKPDASIFLDAPMQFKHTRHKSEPRFISAAGIFTWSICFLGPPPGPILGKTDVVAGKLHVRRI
jgi:hypothetical protein